MKPFKPLTIVSRQPSISQQSTQTSQPPAKKRRIDYEDDDDHYVESVRAAAHVLKQKTTVPNFQPPARKPLVPVTNASNTSLPVEAETGGEAYYNVLWRKFTTKKNKTWDGDGFLSVKGGYATLRDASGRECGRTACKDPLGIGSQLSMSGRQVEIDSEISKQEFLTRRSSSGSGKQSYEGIKKVDLTDAATAKALANSIGRPSYGVQTPNETDKRTAKPHRTNSQTNATQIERLGSRKPSMRANQPMFRAPLLNNTVQQQEKNVKTPVPRHDPTRANVLVMKRPRSAPKGKQIVDVVVDPILTHGERKLREHQRAGVAFLYECVMGMKDYDGEGAILADEMGLGKTLQTIALLWTLLKQNPIYEDPPVVKKALIVCPVTLINTWRREFNRWLGPERIGVLVARDKSVRLTDFTKGRAYSVMIIGYEKLRNVQADLQQGSGIDIVIADEGHRLKTAQNKSAQAIKSLNTERRIILSGTPLQNDLAEFYTMVDFVNPGLLKKYTAFKREFEAPILRSQQPEASAEDKEKGAAKSEELAELTTKFILRRTADILSDYLPPKTEHVLFCKPTEAQAAVYRAIIGSHIYSAALGSSAMSLELINILKKVCNSPSLLLKKDDKGANITKQELMDCIPHHSLKSPGASGKLQVLDSLLHKIRTTTEEKVVLVSNYTSTMDILGNLLTSLSYKFSRLDGTTPVSKRQDIVDQFNRKPASSAFVFLLSAKAGGTGLNLQGASRLILFDLDWNPATDLQAMARIHRDGQKKPCYIYRLVTQGALDEKIFQRQVSKTGLADSIVDGKSGASGFTREELQDLFTLDESDTCQTHKLLGCGCHGKGLTVAGEEDIESARNDLAMLSKTDGEEDENDIDVLHLEDDDSIPSSSSSGFRLAKGYDPDAEEAEQYRNRDAAEKTKMLSLMKYAHFDPANVEAERVAEDSEDENDGEAAERMPDALEAAIEDSVLRSVLRESGKRTGFVFSKLSG